MAGPNESYFINSENRLLLSQISAILMKDWAWKDSHKSATSSQCLLPTYGHKKNQHWFYKSIKWILQVNKIRMMTKVTFWFSNLFDFTIFKHSNSIVSTSSAKGKMTKEIPYQRKNFSSLESCWVYSKRKRFWEYYPLKCISSKCFINYTYSLPTSNNLFVVWSKLWTDTFKNPLPAKASHHSFIHSLISIH